MQFLLLMSEEDGGEFEPADDCRVPGRGADALAEWVRETEARGVQLVTGARLDLDAPAHAVRSRRGETLVTDGPFAETKELVVGFQVIECADLETALAVTARHPSARGGRIELRHVFNDEIRAPSLP